MSCELQFVTTGVPQGSILEQILLLSYRNDLPDYLNSAFTILYTDDTTVLIYDENLEKLNKKT